MMRTGNSALWCKWCFLLLVVVIGLGAAYVLTSWRGSPRLMNARGWCCLRVGQACRPNMDPVTCGDRNAFAFTLDEAACTAVCSSPPSTHAAQKTPQR